MTPMTEQIISTMSFFALAAIAALALSPIVLNIKKANDFLARHAYRIIFALALVSTLGSLFFSEIAGFEPCRLCWFQRIAMYPLAMLFGVALFKKEKTITIFALPLAAIGWLIAAYHNYIYYAAAKETVCSIFSTTSCVIPYFTEFGFVTIPLMSLLAFSLILLMLLLSWSKERN